MNCNEVKLQFLLANLETSYLACHSSMLFPLSILKFVRRSELTKEQGTVERGCWTPAQHLEALNVAQQVKAQLLSGALFRPPQDQRSGGREKKSRALFSTASVKMRKSHTAFYV